MDRCSNPPSPMSYVGRHLRQFAEAFDLIDSDRSRKITVEELGFFLRSAGKDIRDEEVQDIVREFDENQDNMIDFDEFIHLVQDYFAPDPDQVRAELHSLFRRLDVDQSGTLSVDELFVGLSILSPKSSEQNGRIEMDEVQALFSRMDSDGSGEVDADEFVEFVTREEGNSHVAAIVYDAAIPSPIERIRAFSGLPSCFRRSTLAELEENEIFSLGSLFRISSNSGGLFVGYPDPFREVDVDEYEVRLSKAYGVCLPADSAHAEIRDREVRCILVRDKMFVGNWISVPAVWNPSTPDEWEFESSDRTLLHIRLPQKRASSESWQLLFELSFSCKRILDARIQTDVPRSVRMAACFCLLDLPPMYAGKVETLPLRGGTPIVPTVIRADEIRAERSGGRKFLRALKSMFGGGKVSPELRVQLWRTSQDRIEKDKFLPSPSIAPFSYLKFLRGFCSYIRRVTSKSVSAPELSISFDPVLKWLPEILSSSHVSDPLFEYLNFRLDATTRSKRKSEEWRASLLHRTVSRILPLMLHIRNNVPWEDNITEDEIAFIGEYIQLLPRNDAEDSSDEAMTPGNIIGLSSRLACIPFDTSLLATNALNDR